MEQKVCKNKKCQKPLPVGYKHNYCESCRNGQAKQVKDLCKGALSLVAVVGAALISVATKENESK